MLVMKRILCAAALAMSLALGCGGQQLEAAEQSQPAPPKKTSGQRAHGRLAPRIIQQVVQLHHYRFRLCYDEGLLRNPELRGRVATRFVIGRDGRVAKVGSGGDLPDKGVIRCIVKAFYELQFPKPEGGIVTVSYPIVFSVAED